jgi:hypothetical protein
MTLTGSWGGTHWWLFNNFETYLLLHFSVVNQVRFNPLKPEDYCLAFSVPSPGLWRGPDQQPLNYSQKPQEALARFIQLFSQPGYYILNAFAGTHSASLAAVLTGRHAVAVKQDALQWRYRLSNYCSPPHRPQWTSITRCCSPSARHASSQSSILKQRFCSAALPPARGPSTRGAA